MKLVVPLALAYAVLVAQGSHAQEANTQHQHWIIVETIIDKTSGKPIHEALLDEPDLRFDTPVECQSIVAKIPPLVSATMTFVLKCRKVTSKTETL